MSFLAGLNAIHALTRIYRPAILRVDLEDFGNGQVFAEYK